MVILVAEAMQKDGGDGQQKGVEKENSAKKDAQNQKNTPKFTLKNPLSGGTTTGQEQKNKELTETLQRLQAEFENYQKRSAKQNEEFKSYANAKLMDEILPVLDSLEAGMQHNNALGAIHSQLYSILRKNGLEKIKAERKMKYNHDEMECLMQEKDTELGDEEVAKVLISGYRLNGKVLRHAKVSVNVKENTSTAESAKENPAKTNASNNENEKKDAQ